MGVASAINHVSELVKIKMRESRAQTITGDNGSNASIEEDCEGPQDFWSTFDKEVQNHAKLFAGQDIAGGVPVQLRTFVDSPPVCRVNNPNPLQTWEAIKSEYSFIYPIAKEYLSILATSVPSERLFSHAGFLANQLRSRLSGKHLEMLVFLRSCPEKFWYEK